MNFNASQVNASQVNASQLNASQVNASHPTILTLYFNEGTTNYSEEANKNFEGVTSLITSKMPDLLFIGNQESLKPFEESFVAKIESLININYEKVGHEFGGSFDAMSTFLITGFGKSIGKGKEDNNIRSTLFIKKDVNKNLLQNIQFQKIGYSCGLSSIIHLTTYKDSIVLTFNYNGSPYCIVNTHLYFTEKYTGRTYFNKIYDQGIKKRSEELICLLKNISRYYTTHNIIFGGDLNFRLLARQYIIDSANNPSLLYNTKKYLTEGINSMKGSIHDFNNNDNDIDNNIIQSNFLLHNELSRLL